MDAVKRKLHGVRVLLHGIASLLRTARPTMDAVGKSYPAVEETSPAVDAFSHGICVLFHGFPFLQPAARHAVDAVEEAFLRHLHARGVEAGEMLADQVRFVGWERGLGRSEGNKYVVEHIRAYFQAVFLQEPHLLLTFAVRGQKS